ncbi:MAG: GNAT family N-acetyltransferase [Candidatus Thiodiazotropha sp. DIVDIV]
MDLRDDFRPAILTTWQPSLSHILQRFPKMVMPAVEIYLHKPDLNVEWVIAAAQSGFTQQGLIVAFLSRLQRKIKITSWYVVPECANHGLGQQLLTALEIWCRKQGIKHMTLDLRSGNLSYAVATHILQKQGWSEHQPLVHRFKVAASTLKKLDWVRFQRKPTGIKAFPWKSLSDPQRKQLIEMWRDSSQFPGEVETVNIERGIECAVSMGLCQEDRVVGWILAHHVKRDLIEYSLLYVDPLQRSTGATILLLGESFRRLAETGAVNVIFQVKVDNHLMLRFVHKRFQPILSEATLYRSEKALGIKA